MAGRLVRLGDTHGAGQRIVTTGRTYGEAMGFGKRIPEGTDAKEILAITGTDYAVEKVPAFTPSGALIPNTYAIQNAVTKNPFEGTVGARHELFQNTETVGFGEALVDVAEGALSWEAGGYLKNGAVTWYQARIPGDLLIRETELGNDVIQPFIWMANSHVGECSFLATFTGHMPFCNNQTPGLIGQVSKAANEGIYGSVKVRHTSKMRDRVAEARRVMSAALGYFGQHVEEMRELDRLAMTQAEMRAFAEELIGDTEDSIAAAERTLTDRTRNFRRARIDRLEHLFGEGLGATGRSRFDAYKAVTEMSDHHVNRRSDESRFRSIVFGENDELKGRALRTLLNVAR